MYSPPPIQDPWPDLHQQIPQLPYSPYASPFYNTYATPGPLAAVSSQVQSQHSAAQQPSVHTSQRAGSYAASQETFEGRLEADLELAEIQVPLGRNNYKRKFHHLVCWEEKRHIEILANK